MATFDLFRNRTLSENKEFQRPTEAGSIKKICLTNGILTSVLLVMSFIALCAYTHHVEINQLSVANLFILAFGIYFALENFSPSGRGGDLDYFEGFKVGLYTSLVAVGLHALFILVYTNYDPTILERIKETSIMRFHLNPITMAGGILFEGLASGLIITFCLMQYFKKN